MMQFPEDFRAQYAALYGEADFEAFTSSFEEEVPVSIRVNPLKWPHRVPLEPVPWASNAFLLAQRPLFACDPLWHSGAYYVQDASSMFLEHLFNELPLEAEHPVVLDLCGAPGGKATHLAALLGKKGGLLVANESIASRAAILAENLRKWGSPDVLVTNNDPAALGKLEGLFDVIVADVPCSGEGLFRKNPAAMSQWSLSHVALCAARQQRIIADVWPALKPGGFLIYSTCTFNALENEENLRWISRTYEAEPVAISVDQAWNLVPSRVAEISGWHFFPHRVPGEGFFIAAFRKSTGKRWRPPRKSTLRTMSPLPKGVLDGTTLFTAPLVLTEWKGKAMAINPRWLTLTDYLHSHLKVSHTGVAVGSISGRGWVAGHDLYLSPLLARDYLEPYALKEDEVLRFLAKEHFMPSGLVKGERYLATYRGVNMGGFKYLGNRVNTSFPTEWRLRNRCKALARIL
ncbi:MAG: rRNA methyltransferase [Bacteroidetes bacterium]|nr:MAG: rRNA methyltransferase [Bacteroidota bacterium]